MSAPQTIYLTQSLANEPRAQPESWVEEIETHARIICAQHEVTGALTLVASDAVWKCIPVNVTTAVRIAAGDPPHQPHANNATAAVVSLFKMEATRYADYSMASSTLNTALLASIGKIIGTT